jgi:hypothetical protein
LAAKRQKAKQASHRGPQIPFIDFFHHLASCRRAFIARPASASWASAEGCRTELLGTAMAGGRSVQSILMALAAITDHR